MIESRCLRWAGNQRSDGQVALPEGVGKACTHLAFLRSLLHQGAGMAQSPRAYRLLWYFDARSRVNSCEASNS